MVDVMVNGKRHALDVPAGDAVLWAIRDVVGLTGTKYGCGIAACGACTVHVDGAPVRSCSVPVASVAGKKITTIEGLAPLDQPHPLQGSVGGTRRSQCGYCQSGQIMAAAALLERKPHPSDADIDVAMTNICRCGCYPRIRAAIKSGGGRGMTAVVSRGDLLRIFAVAGAGFSLGVELLPTARVPPRLRRPRSRRTSGSRCTPTAQRRSCSTTSRWARASRPGCR